METVTPTAPYQKEQKAPIWWSNAIFFVAIHILAVVGVLRLSPWWQLDSRTLALCIASWQLATFGITMGYHRVWSHKSAKATMPLRIVLAGMGTLGAQGSIRWWVLRHRLHHRFTDTASDPYNAKQGFFHSHMGWIFRKPVYPKMKLIDRKDLDLDPVVNFQHKYYIPLTLALNFALPTLIGWSYGDAMGGYIWGGIVARILIWHFTFFINSAAHYLGEQAYSEEVTARGNFLLAVFTGGEANHNYHHAFPRDYRNGPRWSDWDPTKWFLFALHNYTPFLPQVHQTPESEIMKARCHVLEERARALEDKERDYTKESSFSMWSSYASATSDDGGSGQSTTGYGSSSVDEDWSDGADDLLENAPPNSKVLERRTSALTHRTAGLPRWTRAELLDNVKEMRRLQKKRPLVLLLKGFAVDVTSYASEHPGGQAVLWTLAVGEVVADATAAFEGGLNNHGWSAREKMATLRFARIVD